MSSNASVSAPRYRKHFIPLESNPEVFTELVHKLGVSRTLCFQDVLSLDDSELLAMVPRPAYALVLVFPTTEAYENRIKDEESLLEANGGAEGDVLFFKQTINNACGLYALLHAVCNGEARGKLESDSFIANLLHASMTLTPNERAQMLEENEELEQVYSEVAQKGDTEAPSNVEDEVDFHYIAFVKSQKNGHLYQLDGDRKQPIDLGLLTADQDMLSETCLDVIRNMMAEEADNPNFSLMALVEG